MIAPTHISFAAFIYLLLLTTIGVPLSAANALAVTVSSVLPDIDNGASIIGKLFPWISHRLERKFGHRTLTHSFLFLVALCIVLLPLVFLSTHLYVCSCIGYASHPFLDTMTVHGVKLFYPFSTVNCVFPLEVNNPHRYRVQTGSKTDKTLAVLFMIGCVPTFLIAHQGYERFIRSAQQSIEAAVRDYSDFSKDYLVLANVNAYNMLTKQPLRGTLEIIGALNPNTLVFKGPDGHLHTLGKNFEADYVAEEISCVRGMPAHSFVRTVDMSNQLMADITSYMDSSAENYCFGDLTISDKISLPENIRVFSPITGSGNTVKFNFATLSDIRDFNLDYAFVTKGIITIKSIVFEDCKDSSVIRNQPLVSQDTYAQISCLLSAKESLTLRKKEGDTLNEQEIIATKDLSLLFDDQIALNDEKRKQLEHQDAAAIADLDQRIANAEQLARIDSTEYNQSLELSRARFISPTAIQASELRWHKDKQRLQQLISERSVRSRKTLLELHKSELNSAQLRAKAKAAERLSAIRSTVRGVLVGIRQAYHDNKTRFTFIIRRLETQKQP